jgi:hypothetical protein
MKQRMKTLHDKELHDLYGTPCQTKEVTTDRKGDFDRENKKQYRTLWGNLLANGHLNDQRDQRKILWI